MAEAARITGRSRDTVRRWRSIYLPKLKSRVGRPRRNLDEALLTALGTASDADIAKQFNLPKTSVRNYRIERSIPAFRRGAKDLGGQAAPEGVEGSRALVPTSEELAVIEANTLLDAATILKRSRTTLRRWRREYLPDMVVPMGRRRRELSEQQLDSLGSASDASLARRFNLPERLISQNRKELGLPVYRAQESAGSNAAEGGQ